MTSEIKPLSKTTRFAHWTIGLLMIMMLAVGLYIASLERGPEKGQLIGIHMSVGLIVLVLATARIVWRLWEGLPEPTGDIAPWQHRLSKLVHFFLLAGTIFMPISGIMMSLAGGNGLAFLGLEIIGSQRGNPEFVPNQTIDVLGHIIHGLGGKLLIAAILLHVAGAMKHHVVDKDSTLMRMMGQR